MSQAINNNYRGAGTAADNGGQAKQHAKGTTIRTARVRRRWPAAFIVACSFALATGAIGQSADPRRNQGVAGEPRSDMPLIEPIGVSSGKLVDVVAQLRGSAIGEESAPIFVKTIPSGYRDWRLISVAHEAGDLNDLRAILGNDKAIKAYRERKLPFPDGTIIARLAWSYDSSEENNKVFGRPQSFVAGLPKNGVQFMVRDSKKYASTGGWGYAHFVDGKPADDAVLNTCFSCHAAIKERDFVFTRYAP